MGKGYAEGPAVEEAEARRDALERAVREGPRAAEQAAVYGSTRERPERHFIGWREDVDPDALFEAGDAYGLVVVPRVPGPDGQPVGRHTTASKA